MNVPEKLLYSKEHEWIEVADGKARIGITDHAQQELGDVVFVELPKPGDRFEASQSMASVESVKAVSEVYSPLTLEILEVNNKLLDKPEKLNSDPYGDGWIARVKLTDESQLDTLLSSQEYSAYLKEEGK